MLYSGLAALLYALVPTTTSCLDIDSTGYDRLALHFAQTGELVDPQNSAKAPVQTVGYPFIVGLIYKVFGHNYFPVILLQIICMALSMWFIMICVSRLWGGMAARCAGLICALNLGFLVYPQFLLAESFLVLFLSFFLERFVKYLNSGSMKAFVLAASSLGVSLIIKPAALLFCAIVLGMLLLSQDSFKKRLFLVMLFVLCVATPLFCYMMRNKLLYGYFHLAPMMSLNMYYVFLSKVIAMVQGISVEQAAAMIPAFQAENTLDERGWQPARELFYWYLYNQPGMCIMVWMQNVLKSTFGLFSTQLKLLLNPSLQGGDISFFLTTGSWSERLYQYITSGAPDMWVMIIALFEAIWSVIRWILVMIAGCFLYNQRQYLLLIFFGCFIMNGLVITGFDGCGRYRIVIEPALIILTAYAVMQILARLKQRFYSSCTY